jgi:hypothetical protein
MNNFGDGAVGVLAGMEKRLSKLISFIKYWWNRSGIFKEWACNFTPGDITGLR